MAAPDQPATPPPPLAAVPAHAWAWLQRSRPVLSEVARRLTGEPPTPGFVDELREACARNPFTQAVLADVVAEVAFSGRVPTARPPGASWDRGLTWWAAALAGTTPAAFDASGPRGTQHRLFDDGSADAEGRARPRGGGPRAGETLPRDRPAVREQAPPPVSRERRALADALRALLREADGDQVPASAVRQLVAALDPR